MSSPSSRKHAGTGVVSTQPPVPEPSFAERARTLVHMGRVGSLSTLSRKRPGFPFGSLMPYGLDGQGRPIFLISTMAMHTQNLQEDARASLLVTQPDASGDPLGAGRVTLVGNVAPVAEPEVGEAAGFISNVTPTVSTGWISTTSPFSVWTWRTSITWAASG
jgi:heme iron utilization protein